jgi:toxin CptA
MHNAPSVVYPVGRCVFHGWLLGLLGALNAIVWFLLLDGSRAALEQPWSRPMSLAALVACGVWVCAATMSWVRSPEGVLVWNAERRQAEGDQERGVWLWRNQTTAEDVPLRELERVLDLQDRVLLRAKLTNASSRWIWAERRRDPLRWHDLRRALV